MNFFFLNEMMGWVGCQNNIICKIIDGGEIWLEYFVINNLENYFCFIFFINDSKGWVSGVVWDFLGF